MKISIICPIYNAENYIEDLYFNINRQKDVYIEEINFILTESKFLKCPNTQNCPAQILGSLKLFCDVLEIKGISDKTIEKLYSANLIKLPGDFYKLKVSDFTNLTGLGDKSGTNIVNQIQSKKELTLKEALAKLNAPSGATYTPERLDLVA